MLHGSTLAIANWQWDDEEGLQMIYLTHPQSFLWESQHNNVRDYWRKKLLGHYSILAFFSSSIPSSTATCTAYIQIHRVQDSSLFNWRRGSFTELLNGRMGGQCRGVCGGRGWTIKAHRTVTFTKKCKCGISAWYMLKKQAVQYICLKLRWLKTLKHQPACKEYILDSSLPGIVSFRLSVVSWEYSLKAMTFIDHTDCLLRCTSMTVTSSSAKQLSRLTQPLLLTIVFTEQTVVSLPNMVLHRDY